MSIKIKVSAGFAGVVSRGAFENSRPSYTAELEYECKEGVDIKDSIDSQQKLLQEICYSNFKRDEQNLIVERIQRERKDLRFREIDGEMYPSVTSILSVGEDFFISEEELVQYASQSQIEHKRVSHKLKTGKYLNVKELLDEYPELSVEYLIVKKGSLGLKFDGADFEGFLEAYPLKATEWDGLVFSKKHRYCGSFDFVGVPEANKKEGIEAVETVFDVKRTPNPEKNFMQLSAYAKAREEMTGVKTEQLILVPLNDKTKQGFSKPVVTKEVDKYFALFLDYRKKFEKRYGA